MTPIPSFGIMISCYSGDMPLLKACLNSIRQYLPPYPVCLIKHGDFDTRRLERLYSASVLDHAVIDPRLRSTSFGYGLTKMVSFWHSPFERFLHIDADAICWGDFTAGVRWWDYDLIFNEPHEVITDQIQRTQYFVPELVFPSKYDFDWRNRPYFNTGVFFARRGLFDLEEYLDLRRFQEANKGAIFTDQGHINLMAFGRIARGAITATQAPLQVVVPVHSPRELQQRFRFAGGKPVVRDDDRRLIHWAGKKPTWFGGAEYAEPMSYFRKRHLKAARSLNVGSLALRAEDLVNRMTAHHGGSFRRAAAAKFGHIYRTLSRTRRRSACIS